jgi:hypothetical protein
LSNNGGQRWYLVTPGKRFTFPSIGSDLRWKAELSSLSPARTPRIEEIVVLPYFDSDGDGTPDFSDNCPNDPNVDQADADTDGIGDVCDNCPLDPDNDIDGDTICGDVDNCPVVSNTDQADADEDGYGDACDCSPTNSDTYPGATEIHDTLDNQCPGDLGYGLIDEISGICGFHNPGDKDEFSWPVQDGATRYEVARCEDPQFSFDCTLRATSETYWSDHQPVAPGTCHHYLVRALEPNIGSWGAGSTGERADICP